MARFPYRMQKLDTSAPLSRQDSRLSPYNTFHQNSAQLTGQRLFKHSY